MHSEDAGKSMTSTRAGTCSWCKKRWFAGVTIHFVQRGVGVNAQGVWVCKDCLKKIRTKQSIPGTKMTYVGDEHVAEWSAPTRTMLSRYNGECKLCHGRFYRHNRIYKVNDMWVCRRCGESHGEPAQVPGHPLFSGRT